MSEPAILRCDCANEKTLVECSALQDAFDFKQVCLHCHPGLMTRQEILNEVDQISGGLNVAVERCTPEAIREDALQAVRALWKLTEEQG